MKSWVTASTNSRSKKINYRKISSLKNLTRRLNRILILMV